MFYHLYFQKIIQKYLFTPWKLQSTMWFRYLFWSDLFILDWYFFQSIVLLKPDFNCCSNFALSWVDKVTTATESFVSVIANFPSAVEVVITQSLDQIEIRLASQLINDISGVLQKLLKYFNDTVISTSFVSPLLGVLLVIFTFDLNDSESAKLSFGSSL